MQNIHLIGIIAENKNIPFIKEMLNFKLNNKDIFYINNKNLDNLKNIRFDVIVIFNSAEKIIQKKEQLKYIIEKAKWIILNSDIKENLDIIQNLTLNVITFGFHSKATITTSSIGEREILVCIQRNIKIEKNNIIEPQEIKIKSNKKEINENAVSIMGVVILEKMCQKR